jgi:predicted nucleic acid-binding protein
MLLYVDVSALKRPFDERTSQRVHDEAQAVLAILERAQSGVVSLAWSSALAYENDADPDRDVRDVVARWAEVAATTIRLTPAILLRMRTLVNRGFGSLDAAHVAFAEAASCDAFVTCDDRLIRRSKREALLIPVLNPLELVQRMSRDGPATDR